MALARRLSLVGMTFTLAIAGVASSTAVSSARPTAAALAADADDEIHSSFGDDSGRMWLYWRGPDTSVDYGTSDVYESSAAATPSPITPVDVPGPFWRVELTGLEPGTTYHYRIGADGLDHTFTTAPVGDFTWVDIGDTGTSYYQPGTQKRCNKTWIPSVWQLVADQQPALVTHGGDISYANDCGQGAVHQFWNDIAPVATTAAMEFAWGNHEFGQPTPTSPSGTPADSLANYKGRHQMPHAQSLTLDSAKRMRAPGCPGVGGVNGCRGDDWGWFVAGPVLFINYPEVFPGVYPEWQAKADALMATAQLDPSISFIVTFGHRPAYSSQSKNAVLPAAKTAIDALGDKYSPSARPDGKYVLNIGHHVHAGEVFSPQHGVVQVTNGSGGSELAGFTNRAAGSLWVTRHTEFLRTTVTAQQLTLDFICGPVYTLLPNRDPCAPGTILYSQVIQAPGAG